MWGLGPPYPSQNMHCNTNPQAFSKYALSVEIHLYGFLQPEKGGQFHIPRLRSRSSFVCLPLKVGSQFRVPIIDKLDDDARWRKVIQF